MATARKSPITNWHVLIVWKNINLLSANKKIKKCVNCVMSKEKFKINRNIEHAANEIEKCETYKSRKAFLKTKINYNF